MKWKSGYSLLIYLLCHQLESLHFTTTGQQILSQELPFLGCISLVKFQNILWNLHVVDTTNNPPPGMPNYDLLAKVHPLITMCQNNFRYTPGKFLVVDEVVREKQVAKLDRT